MRDPRTECTCPAHRVPLILHTLGCPMREKSPQFLNSLRLTEMRQRLEQDSSNDSANCNDLDELLTMCGFPPPAPIVRTEKRPPRESPPARGTMVDLNDIDADDFTKDPDGDPL